MMTALPYRIGQKKKPTRAILGALGGKFYFSAVGEGGLKDFLGKMKKKVYIGNKV